MRMRGCSWRTEGVVLVCIVFGDGGEREGFGYGEARSFVMVWVVCCVACVGEHTQLTESHTGVVNKDMWRFYFNECLGVKKQLGNWKWESKGQLG